MSSQDKVLPELSSKGNAVLSGSKTELDPKEIMSKLKTVLEASRKNSPKRDDDEIGKSPKTPIFISSDDDDDNPLKDFESSYNDDSERDDSDSGHNDNSPAKPKGAESTSRVYDTPSRSPYSPIPEESPRKITKSKTSKKRVSMAGNGDENVVKVHQQIKIIKIEDDAVCYTTPTGNVEVEEHAVNYDPEKGPTRFIYLNYVHARVFDAEHDRYSTYDSKKFSGEFYDINKNSFFPQDRVSGQYEITRPFICYGQIDHPCAPLSLFQKWDERHRKWKLMTFDEKVMVKSTYYCFLTIIQNPRVFQVQPELYQVIFLYAGLMYNLFDNDHDRYDNYGFDLFHNLAHLSQPNMSFIFEYLKIYENQFWIAFNQMLDSEVQIDNLSYRPLNELDSIKAIREKLNEEKAENQFVFYEIAKDYATEFVQFYQPDGTPKFKQNEDRHVPDHFVKNYNMYNDNDTIIPFPAFSKQQSQKFATLFLTTFEGIKERLAHKLEKVIRRSDGVEKSMIKAYVQHFTEKIDPEKLFQNTDGSKQNFELFTLVIRDPDGVQNAEAIMGLMRRTLRKQKLKRYPMNTFSSWYETYLEHHGFRKLPTDHAEIQPVINALADFCSKNKTYTIFFNRFGVIYPRIPKEKRLFLPNQIIQWDE